MFKRVFAAMLAASSVMAMSGVAMATKKAPENGKSHETSKTPVQSVPSLRFSSCYHCKMSENKLSQTPIFFIY